MARSVPIHGLPRGGYYQGGATVRGGRVVGGVGFTCTIVGKERLARHFKSVCQHASPEVAKAFDRCGNRIVITAKSLCPVRTGNLRRSIQYDIRPYGAGARLHVGTNVVYAPFVEYGTSRMAPRPFMRPAIDQHQQFVERMVGDHISMLLAKGFGGR